MRNLLIVALLLAASLAGAQEVEEAGELPSLEEIDRQLNNPLSEQWNIRLQITPVIRSPFV